MDLSIREFLATDGVEGMPAFVLLRREEWTLARLFADLVWGTRAISATLPRPAWTALLIYLSEAELIVIELAA